MKSGKDRTPPSRIASGLQEVGGTERRRAVRPGQLQAFQLAGQQAGHQPVAQPAVIGGYHAPGCLRRMAGRQQVTPALLAQGVFAIGLQIAAVQLPALLRALQAAEQAALLLLAGNLQVALQWVQLLSRSLSFERQQFLQA